MNHLPTIRVRSGVAILLMSLALLVVSAVGMAGCSPQENERVDAAAEYVRCSIGADYDGMSKVVAEEAKPYCYALASSPQPDAPLAKIVDETWEKGSLVLEISWGPTSSFMRLSPPQEGAPDEVIVETWNDAGARSEGTLTVVSEEEKMVVSRVDDQPIEKVLGVGSGGL